MGKKPALAAPATSSDREIPTCTLRGDEVGSVGMDAGSPTGPNIKRYVHNYVENIVRNHVMYHKSDELV